jgi:hypothetical protein
MEVVSHFLFLLVIIMLICTGGTTRERAARGGTDKSQTCFRATARRARCSGLIMRIEYRLALFMGQLINDALYCIMAWQLHVFFFKARSES